MHWRNFRDCLKALPADQAALVWRTVSAEIVELSRWGRLLTNRMI